MSRKKRTRRGVILLVVLSLIVLFTLVAVTYAIVASQYKMSAQAVAKLQVVGDPPRKDLDMAAYLVVRDSSVSSSLTGHSLLRDLYGIDGVRGRVSNASATVGGQFILMDVTSVSGTFSQQSGYYNGCVFTFVTGNQRGYSTRVVGYDPVNSQVQIETQDHDGVAVALPATGDEFVINGRPFNGTGFGYLPPSTASDSPALNATVQIPNLPTGMLTYTDVPVAFLPHFRGYSTATTYQTDVGGADEDYDTPDNQNMALAMVPPGATSSNDLLPSYHRPDLIAYWIKWLRTTVFTSLSEPEMRVLFAFPYGGDLIPGTADESTPPWQNVPLPQRQALVDLKRRMIFRPLPEDHPNFNGGNPLFTILAGTQLGNFGGVIRPVLDADGDNRVDRWDVDNDGDGVADSIWIDPGFPVVTARDGRQYKKLVAILIRDMDGRINLNALGALAHTNATYTNTNITDNRGPGLTNRNLPRGLGVGPGDGYLGSLFGTYTTEFTSILQGRYGTDQQPGVGATDDPLSVVKTVGIPGNYSSGPQGYGSPPDLSGQGYIFLDYKGQPVFTNMGGTTETTDDPYDADPLRNRGEDAMFTAHDLERVLRYNDPDASQLSSRLTKAAPNVLGDAGNRRVVTTHSAHIPVSPGALPFDLRTNNGNSGSGFNYVKSLQDTALLGPSLLDIFRVRFINGGFSSTAALNRELTKVVPFEVLHGQKFDINRWLGNGLDDNSNNAVDEPAESTAGETIWSNSAPAQFRTPMFNRTFSYGNDNSVPADVRQLYARHLYCLLRAVMDENYVDTFPNSPDVGNNQNLQRELTYRRLAQWAINAVDFRDRDAVMSPFEYDINPWNGWICDGNLGTDESTTNYRMDGVDNDGDGQTDEADEQGLGQDRRIAWGSEYPDLLLMETLAFHDRRVKDTDYDVGGSFPGQGQGPPNPPPGLQKKRGANMMPDPTLDQYRIPQGSLFLELYCPRNSSTNNASFPMELYDSQGRLDLGRLAPARVIAGANNPLRHPVWRVVVTRNTADGSIFQRAANRSATTALEPTSSDTQAPDRIIWFSPQDPAGYPEANQVFFERTGSLFNQNSAQQPRGSNVVIAPGEYLVACPRRDTRIGSLTQGADSDPDTPENSPHQLNIDNTGNFFVQGGAYVYPPNGETIQQPRGIVCAARPPASWSQQNQQNWLVGMNISEPLPRSGTYYVEPRFGDAYANLQLPFNNSNMNPNFTYNTPFDEDPAYNSPLRSHADRVKTGTRTNFRSLFLQRLADPLSAWNPLPTDPEFGTYYDSSLPVNPYLTIDWGSVDLTVFSGDENTDRQIMVGMGMMMEWIDENSDPNPYGTNPQERFGTRRRGDPTALGMAATNDDHFWPPRAKTPDVDAARTGDGDHNFDHRLTHNLGYLNVSTYGSIVAMPPNANYIGAPDTPFPWLTWNNRPFANPLELMMVPASPPYRLCYDWGLAQSGQQVYNAAQGGGVDTARIPFPYLLNFFLTSPTNTAGEAPHYYRLLDHIETPSLFVGTEKWYQPETFGNPVNTAAASFRPPYNWLSRFREPGRMNINTLFDFREWQAIAQGFPAYNNATFFSDSLVASRRGYPVSIAGYGDYPSIFSAPFRSAAAADIAVNLPGNPMTGAQRFGDFRRTGIEAGLLRPDPSSGSVGTATRPMFAAASNQGYDNTSRNPYFAYRGLNRLSNLVSTNSNVHAMWITVGYFYVEPAFGSAYPDGVRLAQEVGTDDGTVARHRGFYLIDRSLPAAFEAGENHNVDRVFLIRRFIE